MRRCFGWESVAATGLPTDQMLRNYRRLAALVAAQRLTQPVSRDAKDDAVLACARAARADLIITGDDDLLVLKVFEGISIVSPAQALDRSGTAAPGTSGKAGSE